MQIDPRCMRPTSLPENSFPVPRPAAAPPAICQCQDTCFFLRIRILQDTQNTRASVLVAGRDNFSLDSARARPLLAISTIRENNLDWGDSTNDSSPGSTKSEEIRRRTETQSPTHTSCIFKIDSNNAPGYMAEPRTPGAVIAIERELSSGARQIHAPLQTQHR